MLSLQRFFINPFSDRDISDEELSTFTEDHLGRLNGLNGDPAKEEPEMEARYFNESLLKDRVNPVASGSDQFPLHQRLHGK